MHPPHSWLFCAVLLFAAATVAQDAPAPSVRAFEAVAGTAVVHRGEFVATVHDFVIDLEDGLVVVALLTVRDGEEDRHVAIPYDALLWDSERDRLVLDGNPGLVRHAETFDPKVLRAFEKPPIDPSSDHKVPASPTGKPERLLGYSLLTSLLATPVRFAAGEAGSARDAALEVRGGSLAFLIVSHDPKQAGDAESHPVPWAALRPMGVRPKPPQPARLFLDFGVPRENLEKAPDLTTVHLGDPMHRARVYAHFEVEKPAFESGR